MFIVERCSSKANRVISPIVKYTGGVGLGKSVHYIKGCSLIRSVHYERFHCKIIVCCIFYYVSLFFSVTQRIDIDAGIVL